MSISLDTTWCDDDLTELLREMEEKDDADAWLWEEDEEYEEPFRCPDGFVDDRF